MSENRPLAYWLEKLTTDTFPILRRSHEQLLILERDINNVTDDAIAKQVYHDPFLMTNLLRRVAKLPRRGLAGEVTTINRAVMMIGMQPFFLWAKNLPVLEDTLRGKTPVLQRLLSVLLCSYHAAHQAWQWALLRKDINADEVFVATLLQSRIVWAGWLLMPGEMLVIEQQMRRERVDFATAFARHTDYLYGDIQTALAKKWILPDLYSDFLHGHNATRGQGSVFALKLSDAVQRGWWQPQVADIINQIAEWLHQPVDELTIKIHQYSVQAARQSENWYGKATPSAAWLPMMPGEWPDDPLQALLSAASNTTPDLTPVTKPVIASVDIKAAPENISLTTQIVAPRHDRVNAKNIEPVQVSTAARNAHVLHPEIVTKIMTDIKSHMDGSYDIGQLITRILTAMHDGFAMDRVVFALVNPEKSVKARFIRGVDEGSAMQRLNFSLVEKHLFAQLMNKMQAVWFCPASQKKLSPLLLPKIRAQIGRGEFMAMSIHVHNKPLGFMYADYGDTDHMDENIYNGFKQLCTLAAEGMGHLSKKH